MLPAPAPGSSTPPRVAHFVYGLRPQTVPFHVLHYVAIESCRQIVEPDEILVHVGEVPWGAYWDLIRPHVTLVPVDPEPAVDAADHRAGRVPDTYRYAHHADFIRLDALLEHGGIYADIDTVFLRPLPDELFNAPAVIGSEGLVVDELTGERRPSLCNALLLARPRSPFIAAWRDRMAGELNGTWSNHSGFLAATIAAEQPDEVVVLDEQRFYPVPFTVEGLHGLLATDAAELDGSWSVHLWEHLWRAPERVDFSAVHARQLTAAHLREAPTALGRIVRPFLPTLDVW